jgi:hypothetical protein
VITRDQVMPLLLEACPSFHKRWKAYLAEPDYEANLLYIDLGELAHHVLELAIGGATTEFPALFAVVERLHVEGDAFVKEAATIGLLEDIQNIAGHDGIDTDAIEAHLQPVSAKAWAELEDE